MRVAFFGTAPFGADVLRALVARGRLDIAAVVSQPDRPSGRGRRLQAPPVAEAARELGLHLTQPEGASDDPPDVDAGIVVAFGQLIREPLLGAYPLLNLHPSALPRWRGAAPVERAIMAGDAETAVAVIDLVAELDAGPVRAMEAIPIGEQDDAGAIRRRALELGVPMLERALLEPAEATAQRGEVTYAHKLTAADRDLDWRRSAVDLGRVVRALSPHIGARTSLDGRPVTVWKAHPLPDGPAPAVVTPPLVVGAGDGGLQLLEVQPAGKRRMSADEYLRGLQHPPQVAGGG
jgi:methionyl-tRNA formyltransferase